MRKLAYIALTTLVLAACSTVTPPDPETPKEGPSEPGRSVDYTAYSAELPSWREFSPLQPAGEVKVEGSETTFNELVGAVVHTCTTESVDLTSNPSKIVTFNPDVGALWVGSLLQGKHYVDGVGSLAELPIRERAPITLFVDKLADDISRTVENPNAATVQQAISGLVNALDNTGGNVSSSIYYTVTTAYSAEQTAMHLGISARYGGFALDTSFSSELKANEHRVNAHFVQELFTIAVVSPQTPGEFFTDAFTQERIDEQVTLGRLGPDNLPVYVAAITFGRILNFTMTSTASESTMKRIINASYEGLTGGGGVSLSDSDRKVLAESKIEVVAVGGNQDDALRLIRSGDLRDYFSEAAKLSTARPISYEVHNIGDDTNATFSEATRYNLRDCTAPSTQTLRETLSGSAKTSDNPFNCYGCRTHWNSGNVKRTLPAGSYFLQRHESTPLPGGNPSEYECRVVGYSDFVTIGVSSGETISVPRSVTFSGKMTSPHGAGRTGSLTCKFEFQYVRP